MKRTCCDVWLVPWILALVLGAASAADALIENPPCRGDCGGDAAVSIADLVTGVNIALGNTPLDQCPAFDCDDTGATSIDCLVQAVGNALNGCPVAIALCGNGMHDGDEECDDGNHAGGDGCAVNCTHEVRRAYRFDGVSTTIQAALLALPVSFTGEEILTIGGDRPGTGPGRLPLVIRADDIHLPTRVEIPGLACLCPRAVAAPDLGPGIAGQGEIGCGATGLPDADVTTMQDHDISDVDPDCLSGSVEDGSTSHPHAGACNGPLEVTRSGISSPRGTAVITINLAVGVGGAGLGCASVQPNTPNAPQGPDGVPCTDDDLSPGIPVRVLATTATARAAIVDVNFQPPTSEPGDRCPGPAGLPCMAEVTGTPFDCDLLRSGGPADGALVSALPFLDLGTLGDVIDYGAPLPVREFPRLDDCGGRGCF